jgi:hypothetical protein
MRAFQGDTWEFRVPDAHLRHGDERVEINDSSLELADGTDFAVTVACTVYVDRVAVLTPTPLYDADTDVWYVRFALPRAGHMLIVFRFDVGGFVRRVRRSLLVQQGLP